MDTLLYSVHSSRYSIEVLYSICTSADQYCTSSVQCTVQYYTSHALTCTAARKRKAFYTQNIFKGFRVTSSEELTLGGNMKREEWLRTRLHWSSTVDSGINDQSSSAMQGKAGVV